ncbi:MAG: hypothetical protein ACJ8NR_01510 [Sulfurifustis sp.]
MNAVLTAAAASGGGTCQSYSTGGRSFENCNYTVKAPFASGDSVGTVGGTPGVYAWDFGVHDARRTPIVYANPSRYDTHPSGLDSFHVACPLDYFDAAKRSVLQSFLGDGTTPRTIAPVCGTIEQDIAGTAQGNWFHPGSPTHPEDPHLALVHDNVMPNLGVFSVGTSVATLASGVYYFAPTTSGWTNLDFSLATPGVVYCYENLRNGRYAAAIPNTVILAQLTSATTLQIEKRTATSCAALGSEAGWGMSPSASSFER